MSDPYKTLGVTKSATADEIKSAYRKLAKKLHPDVNPGKKDIEQKFKEVTAAYDLLSDAEKRKRYDRGEVDSQGNDRGFGGGDPFGGAGNWRSANSSSGGDPFAQFGGVEDIFAEFMGGMRGNKRGGGFGGAGPGSGGGIGRGADVTYTLNVPFTEAALGGKRRIALQGGKTIDVNIPTATEDGHKLRLRGQGQAGTSGPGDAIIEIRVEPHAHFTRKGSDVHIEVPISLSEALSGAAVKVPTLDGFVTIKVPKNSNSGVTLRLKGKGIPTGKDAAGDMFAKLKIMLPDPPPADLTDVIEKWAKKNPYDPRKKLGWN